MNIQKLHIKDFRLFKDVTIDFPKSNICVLIGKSGAGKTSMLHAIKENAASCYLLLDYQNAEVAIYLKEFAFAPEVNELIANYFPTFRNQLGLEGEFDLSQNICTMPSGERNILMMFARIASICNKNKAPIVLIDNIHNNLHPNVQREIIPSLIETFPSVQFIVTTHSPLVVSSVYGSDIRILDKGQVYTFSGCAYGRGADSILEGLFGVSRRPIKAQKAIDHYFDVIQSRKFDEAEEARKLLTNFVEADDPVFLQADALIYRLSITT